MAGSFLEDEETILVLGPPIQWREPSRLHKRRGRKRKILKEEGEEGKDKDFTPGPPSMHGSSMEG